MPEICWSEVLGSELNQGDFLPNIQVPMFQTPFLQGQPEIGAEAERPTEIQVKDVIVVSHTCDLVQEKIRFVALCPVETVESLEKQQPAMAKRWKEVKKGRHEGLHMLAPCNVGHDYHNSLIVDFREIISLPRGYVEGHAHDCGGRFRLKSPFLEHFSQSFGRFYMRVALPDYVNLP
jgi:hypothetical protein